MVKIDVNSHQHFSLHLRESVKNPLLLSGLIMPVIKYDYQMVVGYDILMPIVEIKLLGPKGTAPLRVLIDSGATYPVFPEKIAEDLGVNLATGRDISIQYGGSITRGRMIDTVIEVGGSRIRVDAIYVEHLAFPFGLLGRRSVFAKFNEIVFLEKLITPRIEFRS